MADIEATDPENNVFGNIGGVVGDAFEMTRSQDELQARANRTGLAGHPQKLTLKDAIAVLIHDVVAFQDRGGHLDIAENERAKALADHAAHGGNHRSKFFGNFDASHFAKGNHSLSEVYREVSDAFEIVVQLQCGYDQAQFIFGKRALAQEPDGVLVNNDFHFVDARLEKKDLTRESGSAGIVQTDDGVERAVHGALDGARHGDEIVHERIEHDGFGESRGWSGGHRFPSGAEP